MPPVIPAPPMPESAPPGYDVVDFSAAGLLLQHQNTESLVKRFFAEIHSEKVGSQFEGQKISMDSDYRAERLNPAHAFVGNLPRDRLNVLEGLAAEITAWMANQLSKSPPAPITWSTLKNDPTATDLVNRIKSGLGEIFKHQQQVGDLGVKYMNSAQRARCCVEIDNGKLHLRTYEGQSFKQLEPITTAAGGVGFGGQAQGMIWVQGPSGRFYTSADFHVGRFHHSSFLAGREARAAGTWHIDRGRLVSINALSGHYKPPLDALQRAIADLIDAGVFINWQVKVEVYVKSGGAGVPSVRANFHPDDFLKLTPAKLDKYQPFPF